MSLFADRRACVRFEVIGTLRGDLEVRETARVLNISSTGALVETATPIAIGSIRPMEFVVDGQSMRVNICARRLMNTEGAVRGPYTIGAEFLSPSKRLSASVARVIAGYQRV